MAIRSNMSNKKSTQLFARQPGQPMTLAEYKATEHLLTRPLTDNVLPVMGHRSQTQRAIGSPTKIQEIRPVTPQKDRRDRGKRQ